MGNYRRILVPGGSYFFTVVTAGRKPWLADARGKRILGRAIRSVREEMPFTTDAIVVLPDHLHVLWTLPEGDADFSTRWQCIKHRTTLALRREAGCTGRVWQPRFWEHWIRDEADYRRHFDYIHYNPVKHGLCDSPGDWPASSFRRHVERGIYTPDWAEAPDPEFEVPE